MDYCRLIILSALLCSISVMLPDTAYAQEREDFSILVPLTSTSMSPTTTSIMLARVRQKKKIERLEEEIETYRKYVLIDEYIQTNESELEAALALGAGDALQDFAEILRIPESDYASWAMHVRTRRHDVLAALQHETTFEQATLIYHIMTSPLRTAASSLPSQHTGGLTP